VERQQVSDDVVCVVLLKINQALGYFHVLYAG
jgi:hypothetical protein